MDKFILGGKNYNSLQLTQLKLEKHERNEKVYKKEDKYDREIIEYNNKDLHPQG